MCIRSLPLLFNVETSLTAVRVSPRSLFVEYEARLRDPGNRDRLMFYVLTFESELR